MKIESQLKINVDLTKPFCIENGKVYNLSSPFTKGAWTHMRTRMGKEELVLIGIGVEGTHDNDAVNNRIDWDSYFGMLAEVVALRSPDANTKHGCIIVKDKRIIATGYNGWPAGSKDDEIPNTRVGGFKYLFVNHAEENAIYFAAKVGVSLDGATAYITGRPCSECARKLISVGIKTWVIGKLGHVSTPQADALYNYWVESHKVQVKVQV